MKLDDIKLDKRIRYFMSKSLMTQKQQLISHAIDEQKEISFQYVKFSGEVNQRHIRPQMVEIMYYQDRPFRGVRGVCLEQKEIRNFHVGRMFEVEIVDSST